MNGGEMSKDIALTGMKIDKKEDAFSLRQYQEPLKNLRSFFEAVSINNNLLDGVSLQIKGCYSGSSDSEDIFFSETTISKYYEWEYIHAGRGSIVTDDVSCLLQDHMFFFRCPGQIVERKEAYDTQIISFMLMIDGIPTSVLHGFPSAFILKNDRSIKRLFDDIFRAYFGTMLTRTLTVKIDMLQILQRLLDIWYYDKNSRDGMNESKTNIQKSIRHIEQHFSKSLKINEVAVFSGYSLFHFTRLFKKYTDLTPVQYINRCRMEYACKLLLETRLSCEEIMGACGYNSMTYFLRLFKANKGTSPSQFRKLYRYEKNIRQRGVDISRPNRKIIKS